MEIVSSEKKLAISHDGRYIKVKRKHVPVYLMMLQKHYNMFSSDEPYGFHEVKKISESNTIVVKRGGLRIKYSIGQYANGTRLYGKVIDDYLLVNEDIINELISGMSAVYLEGMS